MKYKGFFEIDKRNGQIVILKGENPGNPDEIIICVFDEVHSGCISKHIRDSLGLSFKLPLHFAEGK